MKKTFTITALAVLAVSALAVVIDGSIGRGVADGPGGSKGHFDYHVRKVTNDAGTRIDDVVMSGLAGRGLKMQPEADRQELQRPQCWRRLGLIKSGKERSLFC